jgi:hypothetical protein
MPLNATVCGEPGALSAMLSVPLRAPATVGVKRTVTEQLAPAARLVPHVLLCEKPPVTVIEVIVKARVPEFVRLTTCPALDVPIVCAANVTLAGLNVAAAEAPVPDSDTVSGELLALSVIVIAPARLPAVVGVKATEMAQLAPATRLAPHVFVCVKSPDAAMEPIVRVAVPEFVSVTD